MEAHGVNIDSCTPGLYNLLVCPKLVDYFAGRIVSKETLQRNKVMQVSGEKKIIALTYRQNRLLVGCKYRTIEKTVWQDRVLK